MSPRPNGERGSASVWVLAVSILLLLVGAMATVRGAAVLARHRAEAAADVAALAAAGRFGTGDDPCRAAAVVARRNSASLVGCRVRAGPSGRGGLVDVVVARSLWLPGLGRTLVRASARAGRVAAPGTGALAGAQIGAAGSTVNSVWHAGPWRPELGVAPHNTTGRLRPGG